jgi:hypothetical protein
MLNKAKYDKLAFKSSFFINLKHQKESDQKNDQKVQEFSKLN